MLKCSKPYPLTFLVGSFWSFEFRKFENCFGFRYWSFGDPTLRAGPQFRISDFLGVDIWSKLFQLSLRIFFTVSDLRLSAQAFLTPSGKPSSMMHPR